MANTGYLINPLLKKVVDGGPFNNQPLDVNNELCSVSGLPQATKANDSGATNYKVINNTLCPVNNEPPPTGNIGNDYMSREFFRNNCPAGESGTSVYFEIQANTYFSTTKANANTMAYNELLQQGQAYANSAGFCYLESAINNCGETNYDNGYGDGGFGEAFGDYKNPFEIEIIRNANSTVRNYLRRIMIYHQETNQLLLDTGYIGDIATLSEVNTALASVGKPSITGKNISNTVNTKIPFTTLPTNPNIVRYKIMIDNPIRYEHVITRPSNPSGGFSYKINCNG